MDFFEWLGDIFTPASDSVVLSEMNNTDWDAWDKQAAEYLQSQDYTGPDLVGYDNQSSSNDAGTKAPDTTSSDTQSAPTADMMYPLEDLEIPTPASGLISQEQAAQPSNLLDQMRAVEESNAVSRDPNSLVEKLAPQAMANTTDTYVQEQPGQTPLTKDNTGKPIDPKDKGLLASLLNSSLSDRAVAALLTGGFSMLKGAGEGSMLEKKLEREDQIRKDEIARRERNSYAGVVAPRTYKTPTGLIGLAK